MENIIGKILNRRIMLPAALLLVPLTGLAGNPSPADCQAHAKRVQMDSGSVAGGAGRGALRGAAFGAIVGDSSKAAGRGAALGAVAGGLRNNAASNDAYKRAYDSCMAGHVN
jgi:hypothetical protein